MVIKTWQYYWVQLLALSSQAVEGKSLTMEWLVVSQGSLKKWPCFSLRHKFKCHWNSRSNTRQKVCFGACVRFLIYLFILKQGFLHSCRLAWNSLCTPGRLQALGNPASLPNTGLSQPAVPFAFVNFSLVLLLWFKFLIEGTCNTRCFCHFCKCHRCKGYLVFIQLKEI